MAVYPNNTWLGVDNAGTDYGWNSVGYTTISSDNGGGYSADFDPVNGFKADASTKFPTTGFPKAKFQLIMTGAQTDYNYSVTATPDGSVTVDANGHVTLHSKPTGIGDVIIRAELKTDSTIFQRLFQILCKSEFSLF